LSLKTGEKNFNYLLGMSACAQAVKIQHLLELLETQTLFGFNKYLKELFSQAEKNQSRGVVKLVSKPEFNFAYIKSHELLAKNIEHPKIGELIKILNREKEENGNLKAIVFTQFRDTALIISKRINQQGILKAKIFVGQVKKSSGIKDLETTGLTQKEQKKIIDDFSSGKIDILCATCIAEEGLDIPEVNVVLFYEPIPSAIRSIQRAGRTARLMEGKMIVLVAKKTRDEAYFYVSKARERKMHSAINLIKEDLADKKIDFSEGKETQEKLA